ncbi:branched-chain amino acid ABC transporter permease [Acidisphaera sp. L21]|jgi:branched-chain amino acid transport system permease protein|uniref:branched-chain amino acid ABC transporter permease n=1 Tax=Acidisphaera sp. L21 TaxID=1641851 RepID=UPI00131CC356|nr:branched-chain amino acid ABC transporter permease [Acidisphaera sp. L21]
MLFLDLLADGVVTGCAVGVVAVTFTMIYSTTRVFHVAHAGIYTVAGYSTWFLTTRGLPFWLAIICSIAVCAAVGALIQHQLYTRLARRDAPPLVLLIASLGALVVIQNLMAALFSPNILQIPADWRVLTVGIGSIRLSMPQILLAVSSLVIFAGLLAWSRYTSLGKRTRAVAANEFLAEITRLEPRRVYITVMAIASGVLAVPGSLTALDHGLQPYTGTLVLLTATIAMIAGGMGNLFGAFVTSVILAALQTTSTLVIPGQWSIAATFGLFVILMIVAPTGLFARRPR